VPILRYILIGVAAVCAFGTVCVSAHAQDVMFGAAPPLDVDPARAAPYNAAPPAPVTANTTPITPIGASDAANIDGCQVIARIDGQIVQACEVLWHVNKIIEQNKDRIPPDQVGRLRQELIKKELAALLDKKLLYGEFIRTVPAENLPHIQEKLLQPFEQNEVPLLMKALEVNSPVELEQEITRLGSSMSDVRQSFNEKAIASEWMRTKVKVSEEVSPDEMLQFYQTHLSNYEEPLRVRWEEMTVRKSRFTNPAEAYAEMANMGNQVWQRAAAQPNFRGPAFTEVAKARSDGFTAKEKGGEQPWTTKGALANRTLDEALFTLQVGQMSPILETDDAFYIVRVLERKEAGRQPFTAVQAKIRDDLKKERFRLAVEKYIAELRGNARLWTAFAGNISADEFLGRKPGETVQR
jgi:PPIC-type PPIASE domain